MMTRSWVRVLLQVNTSLIFRGQTTYFYARPSYMVELLSTESLQVSRGVGLVTTLVFTFQPLNLFKGCFYSRPTSLEIY